MKFDCAYDELVPVGKLVPNPRNNNKHNIEQIERLAKIIDFQGQRSPIVVSKRSGFIVKGHARLMAMEKLEWPEVAVDYQDYISDAQEYADMTADNEIARWSDLDVHALRIELETLDLGDPELLGLESLEFLRPGAGPVDNSEEETPPKTKSCPECGALL